MSDFGKIVLSYRLSFERAGDQLVEQTMQQMTLSAHLAQAGELLLIIMGHSGSSLLEVNCIAEWVEETLSASTKFSWFFVEAAVGQQETYVAEIRAW